jgi:hypothetical protein
MLRFHFFRAFGATYSPGNRRRVEYWPLPVAPQPPSLDLVPGIGQLPKHVRIQALIPKATVIHQPARLNRKPDDFALFAPPRQLATGEFRASATTTKQTTYTHHPQKPPSRQNPITKIQNLYLICFQQFANYTP